MVFNFYFNNDSPPETNEDLEQILRKMEEHFTEWYEFYKFYTRHAQPPNKHAEKIQELFNALRGEFIDIVEEYNNKINHFADIKEEKPDAFEEAIINHMKNQFNKKDKPDDNSFNMYN